MTFKLETKITYHICKVWSELKQNHSLQTFDSQRHSHGIWHVFVLCFKHSLAKSNRLNHLRTSYWGKMGLIRRILSPLWKLACFIKNNKDREEEEKENDRNKKAWYKPSLGQTQKSQYSAICEFDETRLLTVLITFRNLSTIFTDLRIFISSFMCRKIYFW